MIRALSFANHSVTALTEAPVKELTKTAITTLSEREQEVARLVASGLSNRVAEKPVISRQAVDDYLFGALQTRNCHRG
jgi:DNA-binding NarL/FixJ family response regulator